MATIGNLFVNVSARTGGFVKAMAHARSALNDFGSNIASKVGGIALFGAALTGVAGILSGAFIKAHISAMDAVAKSALALGATTEAYGGLQYAMKLAGVEAEAFNTAMTKMARTLGDASLGVQTSIDALAAVGLTLADLQGLSADQVFLKLIDALNRVPDPARRAALAQDIFGKGAGALGAAISEGTAGLQAYIVEWQRLHGVTDGSLAMLQLADDSFTRLEEIGRGLATMIAIELTPYIGALADYLVGAATASNDFGGILGEVFAYVVPVVEFGVETFTSLGIAIDTIHGIVLLFGAAFAGAGAVVLYVINAITFGLTGLKDAALELERIGDSLEQQAIEQFGQAAEKFDNLGRGGLSESLEQAVERQRETMRKLAEESGKARPLLDVANEELKQMERATENVEKNLEAATEAAATIAPAMEPAIEKALEPGSLLSTVDSALGAFTFAQSVAGTAGGMISAADMSIFAGMGQVAPEDTISLAGQRVDAAMESADADESTEGIEEANEHLARIVVNTAALSGAFT